MLKTLPYANRSCGQRRAVAAGARIAFSAGSAPRERLRSGPGEQRDWGGTPRRHRTRTVDWAPDSARPYPHRLTSHSGDGRAELRRQELP